MAELPFLSTEATQTPETTLSMGPALPAWQVLGDVELPQWFLQTVQDYVGTVGTGESTPGYRAAQLLWQRGIQDPVQLKGFLNPTLYPPTSPLAFGAEMEQAVARLQQAYQQREKVAIWGDFDADGITATAVLWDGLGQVFPQVDQLTYVIPNRLTESHGLNSLGLERLAAQGYRLIVTCDTGSTNLPELAYARDLGLDVIITDHHTLPSDRPPVVAIVNPRYLLPTHPLAHLSGVAVAYKLVEALYQALPTVPHQPLEQLLDLVAIGLIADLVQLSGDCRYLAQRGIRQLQTQADPKTATRPGVAELLRLCKKSGDRPTDISFGLGPRINAVSRIYGDAHFCVELLTSRDPQRCRELAVATELANARRKALQRDVVYQVKQKLQQLDLSTTRVIVLVDAQWPLGVLGIVAGQIAQEYGRPTVLLTVETEGVDLSDPAASPLIARGSARSVGQIDLYQLVQQQSHLLHGFGGHPFAAGLSLRVENLPLFTAGINRQLRQQAAVQPDTLPTLQADLTVTVADLGQALFRELRLLEPYGMGNPIPRLLIQNCWFARVGHRFLQDARGSKVRYIKAEFQLCDDTCPRGVFGVWWEHYKDAVPAGRCDAIVELEYNASNDTYPIRLVALRPSTNTLDIRPPAVDWVEDWRGQPQRSAENTLVMTRCPTSWAEFRIWLRRAQQDRQTLAIAYPPPRVVPPVQVWQTLVGIAKYLSRTATTVTRPQLYDKLGVSDRTLHLGFRALQAAGFQVSAVDGAFQVRGNPVLGLPLDNAVVDPITDFLTAVREDQFRQQYFAHVPLAIVQAMAALG